jgi:hypothetical protein
VLLFVLAITGVSKDPNEQIKQCHAGKRKQKLMTAQKHDTIKGMESGES